MLDTGWLLKGEKLTPLSDALLRVGQQYVVPLATSHGKLGSIAVSSIRVDGGRVTGVESGHAWIRALEGTPVDELRASLASAIPDPLAAPFAQMDPADRVGAVRDARYGAKTHP
jgi:hypothetical protein